MVHKIIGASTAWLLLALGPAFAQPPAEGAGTAQGASAPQLASPQGVGGCIYRNLPETVSRDALNAIMSHADLRSVLRGSLAAAAPRCTGRPFSDSDGAVIGSVFSVYSRMIAAYALGRQLQLPQRRLDAVWSAANAAEKEPFVASAQTFVSPNTRFTPADPEAVKPFAEHLALGPNLDPNVSKLLYMYYSATALNEVAEAGLSPAGAR